MRFILFLFCFSIGLSFIPAQNKDSIFPLWMNRRYALVRSSYPHLITLPYYKYVTRVPGSGYFTAKRNDLYGILDTSGKELVKMEYTNLSSEFDQASKKNYVTLSKPGERILVDELGNIIGKGFPTIKKICGGFVIVQPDPADTSENRLYYTADDKYVKQGLMDLKGNWIEKPSNKEYHGLYGRLLFIFDYNKEPNTGKLYDLKLVPLNNPVYDDVKYENSLENDSLKALKRILAYTKEFIWVLDSNGKELKKQIHRTLPINITGYSYEMKSFNYNGIPISNAEYDGAFIMDNYLLGFDSTKQKTDVYDRHGDLLFTKNYSKIFVPWVRDDNHVHKFVFAQDKTGIYLLDDKLEKKTPALQYVNTDELYKDEQTQLFICQKNKKYGVIDHTGKIIAPFIYKNEPSRYSGGVVEFYGANETNFYSTSGEQFAKGFDDVTRSEINPTIYIVTKGESFGIFGGTPFKQLIPFNEYSSFTEYPQQKAIVATKNGKKYILDKDLRVLNKEPLEDFFITSDSVTFSVRLANKKVQLLSYRLPDPKNSFDWLEGFQTAYDNYSSKDKFFLVRVNSKYGLSNAKSDLLLDTEWDTIISIGYCAALKKGKTYFVTNEKFEVDRSLPFDSIIASYPENYYNDESWRMFKIQVKKEGKWGVFDLVHHKWIIYPNFENVVNVLGKSNSSQRYFTTKINKWIYLVDPEKNILYGEGFNEIVHMASDIFKPIPDHASNLRVNKGNATIDSLGIVKGGRYGIMGPKGKILHKCDADKVWPISYSIYPKEGMIGYVWNIGGSIKKFITRHGDSTWQDGVDANGNSIRKKVLAGREYGETMAGGKFGVVGVNGKEIFPPIYDDMIFKFYGGEGLGNYRASYLDTLPKYDHLIFPIFIKQDGKWGLAEFNGKIILPIVYDSVEDDYLDNDQPAIRLVLNGNVGYVDLQGKEIIPTVYSGEKRFGNYYNQPELTLFQKNGTSGAYTVAALSSTMAIRSDTNGNEYHVEDTITVEQKNFTGGTYGFWDITNEKWALEPVYEDIRMLQVFTTINKRQIPKRASVTGKYPDQCDHFIKGYEPFEIKKNGKWGAYFHGKGIVLHPEFDEIKIENEEIITKQAGVEKRFTFEGKAK